MRPIEVEIDEIKRDVKVIKQTLVEHRPEHFSKRDVLHAFFGALLIGLPFMFKGLLLRIGAIIPWYNVVLVLLSTWLILSAQIFFIGYAAVKDKNERRFGQFWAKRFVTMYGIGLLTSFYLFYIFDVIALVASPEMAAKLVLVLSMPCSIGAAIGSLLKRY